MKKIGNKIDLLSKIGANLTIDSQVKDFLPTSYFICGGCSEVHYLKELTNVCNISKNESLLKCSGKKYLTGQVSGKGYVTYLKYQDNKVNASWFCDADLFETTFPALLHKNL
tara:strand:+ start:21433 stop:21768 length:336 start_codon:yes stop_codon:yes gene_type:complete